MGLSTIQNNASATTRETFTGEGLIMREKLLISTGGGDAPGLNAVIFAVVNSATRKGWEVYGSRAGYGGLLDS